MFKCPEVRFTIWPDDRFDDPVHLSLREEVGGWVPACYPDKLIEAEWVDESSRRVTCSKCLEIRERSQWRLFSTQRG